MFFPTDFTAMLRHTFGATESEALLTALSKPAITSVRLNRLKVNAATTPPHGLPLGGEVPWCRDGYYLKQRPSFIDDPLLHQGGYYVQEAASMFLSAVIRQYVSKPSFMLDLCAAPGGKATLATTALPEGSLLIANEPVHRRANILLENIQKWGHPDCMVTQNMPDDFSSSRLMFDVILCDAPCSGEGMFRKEPVAIEQWSTAYVDECVARQRDILSHAWACLREGGLLIYSTCTLNTLENEGNIGWLQRQYDATVLPVRVDDAWNISPSVAPDACRYAYRFLPHRTQGEGLFMAVLRKGDTMAADSNADINPLLCTQHAAAPRRKLKGKTATKAFTDSEYTMLRSWIWQGDDFDLLPFDDTVVALRRQWMPMLQRARQHLHVLGAGIVLATRKGSTLVPHQALALSTQLQKQAFASCTVDSTQALRYLHAESLQLPGDTPRGFVLLLYNGVPLGFVKNLGNRANNLYPQHWRIRKSGS